MPPFGAAGVGGFVNTLEDERAGVLREYKKSARTRRSHRRKRKGDNDSDSEHDDGRKDSSSNYNSSSSDDSNSKNSVHTNSKRKSRKNVLKKLEKDDDSKAPSIKSYRSSRSSKSSKSKRSSRRSSSSDSDTSTHFVTQSRPPSLYDPYLEMFPTIDQSEPDTDTVVSSDIPPHWSKWRIWVRRMIHLRKLTGIGGRLLNYFFLFNIFVSVAIGSLSTIESITYLHKNTEIIFIIDCTSIGIFTFEFILHCIAAINWREMMRWIYLIDLLAFVPFYVELIVLAAERLNIIDSMYVTQTLGVIRVLRLLRIIQLFKVLEKSSKGYGDVTPKTVPGKLVMAAVMFVSLFIVAFPLTMITMQYSHVVRVHANRARYKRELIEMQRAAIARERRLARETRRSSSTPRGLSAIPAIFSKKDDDDSFSGPKFMLRRFKTNDSAMDSKELIINPNNSNSEDGLSKSVEITIEHAEPLFPTTAKDSINNLPFAFDSIPKETTLTIDKLTESQITDIKVKEEIVDADVASLHSNSTQHSFSHLEKAPNKSSPESSNPINIFKKLNSVVASINPRPEIDDLNRKLDFELSSSIPKSPITAEMKKKRNALVRHSTMPSLITSHLDDRLGTSPALGHGETFEEIEAAVDSLIGGVDEAHPDAIHIGISVLEWRQEFFKRTEEDVLVMKIAVRDLEHYKILMRVLQKLQ
ncbi:hypothetical protein HK098_004385 [Nowakowskiella sp. JEL0407]|nr:hypothetical protein HK098_004385 [Nowakowskiella sp. JEL0407]